jgi:hypothetical protein
LERGASPAIYINAKGTSLRAIWFLSSIAILRNVPSMRS